MAESASAAVAREQWLQRVADGGEIRITRIGACDPQRPPVILIPGMFTAHRFWISDSDIGLAALLAARGFCCYLPDRRGLGDSPAVPAGVRAGLREHLEEDLPRLADHVADAHHRPAFWAGHSFGGIMASLAVSRGYGGAAAGLLLFATQYAVDKRALSLPWSLFTRAVTHMLGRVPAHRVGLGPEDESPAAMDDACRWVSTGRRGNWLTDALARIDCPALAMVGAADHVDPPAGCRRFFDALGSRDKHFEIAGRQSGYKDDYNHPGILVSRNARDDIWPRVAEWLETQQSAQRGQ
ncbi:MAG: hypothetical protein CMN28_13775 [Salinisphaeraceae bacterium]|nr:hypothetical protein [Salinisphaeraceae bacterium]